MLGRRRLGVLLHALLLGLAQGLEDLSRLVLAHLAGPLLLLLRGLGRLLILGRRLRRLLLVVLLLLIVGLLLLLLLFLLLFEELQRQLEVALRLGVVRVEPQGLHVGVDGLLHLPRLQERIPLVVGCGLAEPGARGHLRPTVLLERLFDVALAEQHVADVVVQLGRRRLLRLGVRVLAQRLVVALLLVQAVALVVARRHVGRRRGDGHECQEERPEGGAARGARQPPAVPERRLDEQEDEGGAEGQGVALLERRLHARRQRASVHGGDLLVDAAQLDPLRRGAMILAPRRRRARLERPLVEPAGHLAAVLVLLVPGHVAVRVPGLG